MSRILHPLALTALIGFTLSACGSLAGKGPKTANETNGLNTFGSGEPASIVSFNPPQGAVGSVPTAVTINFSSGSLEQVNLSAISSYTISCGGGQALVSQSVSSLPGLASVTVNLPTITGVANGTTCTFVVSNNLRDGLGNFVIGSHSVSYTISSAAIAGGAEWNEAAFATYTNAVGSPVGSSFVGVGANGMAMQGLLINGGQYVDGIMGVWAQGFSSSSPIYGNPHGASAGGYSALSCPAGHRITGIYGRVGGYIDAIGIICKTADQSQSYQSPLLGGSGGAPFERSCPVGQFATELNGRSGGYLNQLYLGCR